METTELDIIESLEIVENLLSKQNLSDIEKEAIEKIVGEIKRYQALEEKGLLKELPCTVGDKIYAAYKSREDVVEYVVDTNAFVINLMEMGAFGVTMFLDYNDAKEALKKMKEKEQKKGLTGFFKKISD